MSSSGASNTASISSANPFKRDSKDIAWEWGECRDPTNKNSVWCKLCGKKVSGGISRLKEHLVHKSGNVKGCEKVTNEIKKLVEDSMAKVREKKVAKARVAGIREAQDALLEDVGEDDDEDNEVQATETGKGKKRKYVPTSNVRGPLDRMMSADVDKLKQSSLDKNNPIKQELKKKAWLAFAKWAYEVGLPFNAVRPQSFQDFIHAVGDYGRAMPPPTYHHVRVTLLKEVLEETKVFVNSFRRHWETYGCSIMSDFWTDGKGRCLINFLVNCPKGTVFLKSIDASEYIKDATLIVGMINEVIEDVGANNIVSFITDNGSNFKLAGEILEEQHPTIFWLPCAAHCVNLMLQDIGEKLPKVKKVLSEARSVVVYIYNHGRVLNMMRRLTDGKELHRSCVTRFATSFYTLKSMWDNRHHVQVMFVSETWRKSTFASKPDGKNVERIVGKNEFWDDGFFTCQVMSPLVDVLRLVDTEEKPCMGYIYEAMDRAKEQIQKNLGPTNERMCTRIWNMVDKRWSDQLHHPLHAAGFYLNPSIYYNHSVSEMEGNKEIKAGLFTAMDKLIPDEDEGGEARMGLIQYRDAMGIFGSKSAINQRGKIPPNEWWLLYGCEVPILQKFAVKVLSQTCSASPCERNWSCFDNLHSKKRNCLLQAKLNDLVFIQYNQKLQQRFKERLANKQADPIVLREVEENDDWIIPTEEELNDFVIEGDSLTWAHVRAARGADDEAGPSTRGKKKAKSTLVEQEGDEEIEDLTLLDDIDLDADDVDDDLENDLD